MTTRTVITAEGDAPQYGKFSMQPWRDWGANVDYRSKSFIDRNLCLDIPDTLSTHNH